MSKANNDKSWHFQELDDALVSFDEIQEQLNYQKAQDSLRNLVNHLDLTHQEQIGLL